MSSQKKLAVEFLTLYKTKLEQAMKWPNSHEKKAGLVISRRKFEKDSTIPSSKYVEHVLSRYDSPTSINLSFRILLLLLQCMIMMKSLMGVSPHFVFFDFAMQTPQSRSSKWSPSAL